MIGFGSVLAGIASKVVPTVLQKIKESHNTNNPLQVETAYKQGAMTPDTSASWNIDVLQRFDMAIPEICWPVERVPIVITSKFGRRQLQAGDPFTFHYGIDFKTKDAPKILACEKAVVFEIVRPDYEYPCVFRYDTTAKRWVSANVPKGRAWTPRIVLIGKYSNNEYVYKHVDALKTLQEGQVVEVGDVLGRTGNLGYSQGEHLHFEFYDFNEKKQTWKPASDPMAFFQKHAQLVLDNHIPVIVNPQIFHGDNG